MIVTQPVYQYTGRPSFDDYYEPRWDLICNSLPDFEIDPDSTQRFTFPLAADLDGDTIIAAQIILADGLTLEAFSFTDSSVTAVLSGASWGSLYRVTARYTTASGLTLDKTYRLIARNL